MQARRPQTVSEKEKEYYSKWWFSPGFIRGSYSDFGEFIWPGKMRKLVVLELRVYKKLKAGAGQIESCVLSDLDRQMETILNSQRPAHEK